MAFMQTEDVKKLANLARIELTEDDLNKMPNEIDSILGYIQKINQVAENDNENKIIESAGIRNITRPDQLMNYLDNSAEIIKSAPENDGKYIKVKKIL